MVGEPTVELTACISMRSRILLGSNAAAKIPVMPALTTGMVWEFKPVMLNCGTMTSSTSPGRRPITSRQVREFCTAFWCEMMTPFGWPVVPEVYMMAAGS